jgi:hypothetical protein
VGSVAPALDLCLGSPPPFIFPVMFHSHLRWPCKFSDLPRQLLDIFSSPFSHIWRRTLRLSFRTVINFTILPHKFLPKSIFSWYFALLQSLPLTLTSKSQEST